MFASMEIMIEYWYIWHLKYFMLFIEFSFCIFFLLDIYTIKKNK